MHFLHYKSQRFQLPDFLFREYKRLDVWHTCRADPFGSDLSYMHSHLNCHLKERHFFKLRTLTCHDILILPCMRAVRLINCHWYNIYRAIYTHPSLVANVEVARVVGCASITYGCQCTHNGSINIVWLRNYQIKFPAKLCADLQHEITRIRTIKINIRWNDWLYVTCVMFNLDHRSISLLR